MKKKNWLKAKRIRNWTVNIVVALFILSIFVVFWSWISANAKWIAIVTGALLLLFLIFGWVAPKTVRNKLKNRFSLGY